MLSVGRSEQARLETSRVSARAYAAGREALKNRDYDLARAAFRWARRADPGNPLYIHGEAVVARRTGNTYEAENLYRRVLDMAVRSFGAGDPRTTIVARDLVDFYEAQGRHDEAWMLSAHIVDNLDYAAAARSGISLLACVTEICARAGRLETALLIQHEAMALRRDIFGADSLKVDECIIGISELNRLMRGRVAAQGAARAHIPPSAMTARKGATRPASDMLI